MQKYFAVFVIQFLILTRCGAILQPESKCENSIEELKEELDRYDKVIGLNEDELIKFNLEVEQEDKFLDLKKAENSLNTLCNEVQTQLDECQAQSKGQTKIYSTAKQVETDKRVSELQQQLSTKINEIQKLTNQLKESESQRSALSLQLSSYYNEATKKNSRISELISAEKETNIKLQECETKNKEYAYNIQSTDVELRICRQYSDEINSLNQQIDLLTSKTNLENVPRPRQGNSVIAPSPQNQKRLENPLLSCWSLSELSPVRIRCGSTNNEWLLIQQRIDGSANFHRGWDEYKRGFGDVNSDFFLGLEELHRITNSYQHELQIIIVDINGYKFYTHYNQFKIRDEQSNYTLEPLSSYYGTAGDAMSGNVLMPFSTYDRNILENSFNCASHHLSGWWYVKSVCGSSNLNKYRPMWNTAGFNRELKEVRMFIRRK